MSLMGCQHCRTSFFPLFLIFLALLMSSCASMKTRTTQYTESVPLAREGQYEAAALIIENAKDDYYGEKDRVLYYLDLGMLYHWSGEYAMSNEMLTKAEIAIEELFTRSISQGLSSAVLNDNALDYAGEAYEDIYLNVFKALNYIGLGDIEAALVEIRRVHIKLNILEDRYKEVIEDYNSSTGSEGILEYHRNRFYNSAFARYISVLLYRSQGDWDDARIDRELIAEAWETQRQLYSFPMPELPQAKAVDETNALVNIISFSGLGPTKHADTIYGDSGENVIFLTMEGQNKDDAMRNLGFTFLLVPDVKPGLHFKVQFPRLVSRGSEVDRIVVKFDGTAVADLARLESLDAIARETFLIKQPLTVGKTIIRAASKNLAKELGKDAMHQELEDKGAALAITGFLAGLALDVFVDASENADLRISQFFPSDVWAAEFLVLPGAYHVEIEYWRGRELMFVADHGLRIITADGPNLVESYLLR